MRSSNNIYRYESGSTERVPHEYDSTTLYGYSDSLSLYSTPSPRKEEPSNNTPNKPPEETVDLIDSVSFIFLKSW
jgi:hypothetical protein